MKNIRNVLSIGIGLTCLILSTTASAAVVAQKSSQVWDINKPTRIIVASKGLTFASVGYQQSKVYEELYPNDQMLFITNFPTNPAYTKTKQKELVKIGYKITEESSQILDTKELIKILKKNTSQIRSLDIISHNGILLGPWLEDGENRMDFKNAALMSQLKPLFTADAFARIQGCNSGWNVAPQLSKHWGVPVMGSFTSTSFFYLNNSGDYELYESADSGANSGSKDFAAVDKFSFLNPTKCSEGLCLLLKPESSPYHFHLHKSPEAAWLPMMKPICDAGITDQRCQKAQAQSILTQISSYPRLKAQNDKATYKEMVFASVCGSYSKIENQKSCIEKLRQSYQSRQDYFPYARGTQLRCSGLRACQFQHISMDLRKNDPATKNKTVLEYLDNAFIGYDLLMN